MEAKVFEEMLPDQFEVTPQDPNNRGKRSFKAVQSNLLKTLKS